MNGNGVYDEKDRPVEASVKKSIGDKVLSAYRENYDFLSDEKITPEDIFNAAYSSRSPKYKDADVDAWSKASGSGTPPMPWSRQNSRNAYSAPSLSLTSWGWRK